MRRCLWCGVSFERAGSGPRLYCCARHATAAQNYPTPATAKRATCRCCRKALRASWFKEHPETGRLYRHCWACRERFVRQYVVRRSAKRAEARRAA